MACEEQVETSTWKWWFELYSLPKPCQTVVNKFTKAELHKDKNRYNRRKMSIKIFEGRKQTHK